MQEKDLKNLQRYIYKRAQNQSTQEVIIYIEKINEKEPLSQEEWNKLLIPTCSYMDVILFEWLLSNGAEVNGNAVDLANMIVSSQEKRIDYLKKRVELLGVLFIRVENKLLGSTLGYALLNACWYNNIYVVEYLIAKGADINFLPLNGKTPYECSKNFGERFGDYTLYKYLNDYVETGKVLENSEKFYTGKDLMGNIVYQC